eukprot:SAG31_NODE_12296_length_951_cov_2.173709_1_plen_123_part_00
MYNPVLVLPPPDLQPVRVLDPVLAAGFNVTRVMVLHSDFDTNAAAQLGNLLELEPTSSKVGRYTRLILKRSLYSTEDRYVRPGLLPVRTYLLNLVRLPTFEARLAHVQLFKLLRRIHSCATL